MQLENTLKSLSSEVENLSTKNEEFLNDLKKKEFYMDYMNSMKELVALRENHMLLINLIENNELKISNETSHVRFYKNNHAFFSPNRSRQGGSLVESWNYRFGSIDTPDAKNSFAALDSPETIDIRTDDWPS